MTISVQLVTKFLNGAHLRTPALPFDRCTAPVKLPARHGLRSASPPGAARAPGGFTPEPFLWVTKIPA